MFRGVCNHWTVWYYVFTVLNITTTSCSSTGKDDDTAAGIIDGNLVLGGLFRIRKINGTNKCAEDVEGEVGIQRVEAMLFAIHKVNKDPNLLPNITLGAEIRDTCSLKTTALDESLKFILDSLALRSSSQQSDQCKRNMTRDVVGVVGASRSTLSIEVAKLLRLFKVPQVSYASTSAELSNKKRYSYFARTVPPDSLQALAILHVVKKFEWKSVFTVNSAGSYGEKGIEEFKKHANGSVCVVLSEQVTDECSSGEYDSIIQKFLKFSSTHVVVLFLKDNHCKMLLQAAKRQNYTKKVWIASDEWGTREDVVENLGDFFYHSDAITLTLSSRQLPEFEKHFRSLSGNNLRKENPWFQRYWQQCFNSLCNTTLNKKLPYVIDAVYAFARALHDMYVEKCPRLSGLCEQMKPVNGTELRDRILKNNPARGHYTLFHYNERNQIPYTMFGEWQNKLTLNVSTTFLRMLNISSTCHDQCNLWSREIIKKGTRCCIKCLDCPNKERQYINKTKDGKCDECPLTQRPNAHYNGCEDLPLRHISSTWFITITFFACLGALCVLIITALMLSNINTPVVKASEKDLIFLLLFGVLMNYAMSLVLVTRANVVVCAVQRFGYGFSASICYASLLIKTDRIGRIFTTRNIKSVRFTKPHTQLVLLFLLIAVEVSLAVAGLIIRPPGVIKVLPTKDDIFAKCNFESLDDIVAIPYNLLLILVCTVYSFRIRKTTTMFNEEKYLGFVMYSTCIIWIAFLPVHFGTAESYQAITMSLNMILNATTILVCLFGPKVYIIVFRPLRNVERSASVTVNHFVLDTLNHDQSNHVREKSKGSQDVSAKSSKHTSQEQKREQVNSKSAILKNNVNENINTRAKEVKAEHSPEKDNPQSQDEKSGII